MLVVGLVRGGDWEPPSEEPPPPRRRPPWLPPWQALAWFAAWCWMLVLARVIDHAFGPAPGYAALLLAVALGGWRVDRWCARQYWTGLRNHRL
jgi:hypothetical protein